MLLLLLRSRLLELALILLICPQVFAQEYCLALRGNGELMPAHWGAMANLTEKMGLPVAQAGGSSATITMMMNEAVATNKFITGTRGQTARNRAGLLFKSFEGFVDYLGTTPEWRDFVTLYQRAQSAGGINWVNDLQKLLQQAPAADRYQLRTFLGDNLELLKSNYRTGVKLGLISERNYAPLMHSLGRLASGELSRAEEDLARAKFYADELKETIRVFGSFNASTDANLFFRPGLVNFARFAEQLGRMAQFYSARTSTAADDALWEAFFGACESTPGQLWTEIQSLNRECSKSFTRLLEAFLRSGTAANFADLKVGSVIASYPTTAVLTGPAAQQALTAIYDYDKARDPKFGFKFFLKDPDAVKFGYWGEAFALRSIEAKLPKDKDEKSRRFLALGQATWKKVLALSPAEPGLAAMQTFEAGGSESASELVSVGGWSDLHPMTVLRASGCSRIIYITRRGAESPFAKGVAKRLFSTRENDPAADELLAKLYDLGNPESSMRQSLDQADAVLCTDWNRFNVKSGVREMIRDSYRASPYFVRNRKSVESLALMPQLNPRDVTPDGKPVYEGCF